jgi:hypothetical protein
VPLAHAPIFRDPWNDCDQIIRFDRNNQKSLSNRTAPADEKGEHSVCDCSFACLPAISTWWCRFGEAGCLKSSGIAKPQRLGFFR